MATYKSYESCIGNILKEGDVIIFAFGNVHYNYRVHTKYLSSMDGRENYRIFSVLSLEKYKFCSAHYGYPANSGNWPVANIRDFPALTRVVTELFKIIESNIYHKSCVTRCKLRNCNKCGG